MPRDAPDSTLNPAPRKSRWLDLPDLPPASPPRRRLIDSGILVLAAFTLVSGSAVLWRDGLGRVLPVFGETAWFLAELAPKVVAGIFIAATLPLVLPKDRVAAWIGHDSGLRGLAIAALSGTLIPGGPMVIFLLGTGFLGAGADLGAVVAFISGWSLLSLNRTLIWEMSFLPLHLVAIRFLVSLPMPLLMGTAVRFLINGRGR